MASSWLSLAPVAAAAGVFAVAGETVARRVLGASYGGGTGAELGRLVAYLAPWIVVSVAVTVTFPLLFVRGRARLLPLLALAALVGRCRSSGDCAAFGLAGVAAGIAVTTALVLAAMLARLGALSGSSAASASRRSSAAGSRRAFGLPRLVVGPSPPLRSGSFCTTRPCGLAPARAAPRVGVPATLQ